MLYSHTEPVVESCTGVKFYSNTYEYDGLLSHLMKAKISLWNNKWTEVYDFTPHKTADDGTPNWTVVPDLYEGDFIVPLERMKGMLEKVRAVHGEEVKTIRGHEVENDEPEEPEFDRLPVDLGQYFKKHLKTMTWGVPPSK